MAHVLTERDRYGVATVTLNRPEKRNAFNDEVIAEIEAAFTDVGGDDAVRVVVLAANGPSFCGGADVNWLKASVELSERENYDDAFAIARMLRTVDTVPKPTLALVQGAVMGGGAGLVAACDMAVAARGAFFAMSEVRLGLIPAAVSPYVVAAIGVRAARRYFLTAERLDAAEALRLGFVHEVVEDVAALAAARDRIVGQLLACAPGAIAASKDLIRAVGGKIVDEAMMKETAARIARQRTSADGQEGLAAFIERRAPGWAVDR
ncbi:MAG: enoyl-CoA hydratase/isomerase family protein [Alphaproteobacteria bacterium]|nr:enoyl-CoA hydratase/isomerase family protein [Alphaproteobacteria bacterium]